MTTEQVKNQEKFILLYIEKMDTFAVVRQLCPEFDVIHPTDPESRVIDLEEFHSWMGGMPQASEEIGGDEDFFTFGEDLNFSEMDCGGYLYDEIDGKTHYMEYKGTRGSPG